MYTINIIGERMNKEVNDNLNENTSQEDIEFLTTAVPIIKDLNDEQIERCKSLADEMGIPLRVREKEE